ncbi:MAG TPA: peptidoglycan DD-metalloendopeptidase family protein [Burkholderiales bacterium]|nr:peptidoglycan DD-metalloendopeptidase family protein [Burkholderiales bacterium]
MSILAQSDAPRDRARRRRAVVAIGVAALLLGVAATGTVKDSPPPAREIVVDPLPLVLHDPAADPVQAYWHETRFERGDTFAALLSRLGVDGAETTRLLKENGGSKPFRNLRPGMTVQAQTSELGQLLALRFLSGEATTVLGFQRDGVRFTAIEERAELARHVFLKSGEIQSSLFATADAVGLPDSITIQMADMFSGDIDFHRDLRRGDSFRVVYEVFHHNGRPLQAGRVLAAEFVNDRKAYRAVWFVDESGKGGYYTADGKNLRKAFLRSPLEFSRITSGFRMRFHPILREWRAHKGVDYGGPTGTRVKATADGTVELAGWQGGYGNVVVLRHSGGITTLYAHLRGVASGIRRGARVAQGDVIGYVGATGWATGPHLHYEFRVNNQHRNPLTIAMPAAEPVAPQRMAAFRAAADPLAAQLELLADANVAALE